MEPEGSLPHLKCPPTVPILNSMTGFSNIKSSNKRSNITLINYHFKYFTATCFGFKSHLHAEYKPVYTGCPRRNVPDFGRVFLMLNYTEITQNTYVQS
jgi:hypothetical protein